MFKAGFQNLSCHAQWRSATNVHESSRMFKNLPTSFDARMFKNQQTTIASSVARQVWNLSTTDDVGQYNFRPQNNFIVTAAQTYVWNKSGHSYVLPVPLFHAHTHSLLSPPPLSPSLSPRRRRRDERAGRRVTVSLYWVQLHQQNVRSILVPP